MNKEFEEWYENKYPESRNIHDFWISKEAYKAGQQSAKPRWIPVTERLPTAADGIKYNIDGEKNVGVIAKNIYGVRSFAFYSLDKKKWCDGLEYIEWQPLPEE